MADGQFTLEARPTTVVSGDPVSLNIVTIGRQTAKQYLMIWQAQSVISIASSKQTTATNAIVQNSGNFLSLPGNPQDQHLIFPDNTGGLGSLFQNTPNRQFGVLWDTTNVTPGTYELTVTIYDATQFPTIGPDASFGNAVNDFLKPAGGAQAPASIGNYGASIKVNEYAGQQVTVQMRRAFEDSTPDQALWTAIRKSTNALSFNNYNNFMEVVLCGGDPNIISTPQSQIKNTRNRVEHRLRLPFPDTDAYRQLKVATEVFIMLNCGVSTTDNGFINELSLGQLDDESRRYYRAVGPGDIERAWNELTAIGKNIAQDVQTLPYLAIIRRKLGDVLLTGQGPNQLQNEEAATWCTEILMSKLTHPCLLELIWSYWHEEGMLAQTMNAITWRFQNRRGPGDRDPLAMLEIDPLRPLSNFIWGYIQDEQHRLTVPRRAYEYDHHYGLNLLGKAVPTLRGADTRSRFLEAFHNLLFLCAIFFKEDDDTTVVADGFPILNALKEVHLQLTMGAANQYGDLPWTARQEMLMQEWLLARPEFRNYLPSRIMVDYPEPWMDRVESMKTLQGWSNTSIMHFRDLGVFGEQILLSIRYGAWPSLIEPQHAANWARYWRPEIQGYYHAYRAATGVDLTERVDATLPSLLLQQRLKGLTYDSAALPQGRERLQLPQGRIAVRALPRLR